MKKIISQMLNARLKKMRSSTLLDLVDRLSHKIDAVSIKNSHEPSKRYKRLLKMQHQVMREIIRRRKKTFTIENLFNGLFERKRKPSK